MCNVIGFVVPQLGPFVDASHKQISKGDLGGHTFQTLFMHLLRDFVVKQLRFTKTQVMLVPAVTGASVLLSHLCSYRQRNFIFYAFATFLTDHHHECVFPQPPFSLDADALRDLDAPVNKVWIEACCHVDPKPEVLCTCAGPQLRFLPNPAILRVNDVTIALSSLDALTRLASEGYEK